MAQNKFTFEHKILPDQHEFRRLFRGTQTDYYAALYKALMASSGLVESNKKFKLQISKSMPVRDMASSPVILEFLKLLIRIHRPSRVLEIGTFLGLSAMSMAGALGTKAKIITIEKYQSFADLAKQNISKNGFASMIKVICGDALDILKKKNFGSYDFIFLDGHKEKYDDYFRLLAPRLNRKGVMVVDDVFFHGDALNKRATTEKGKGVQRFLKLAAASRKFEKVVLPIGNGMMLLVKT